MLDQIRHRMASYLAEYDSGILTVMNGSQSVSMPVRYHSRLLGVTCLVVRWSDLVYALEQQPTVELLIPATAYPEMWMHYQARAHLLPRSDVATFQGMSASPFQYVMAQLTPYRIDLIDQRVTWGARETLEL
jgi:hypothetical protein